MVLKSVALCFNAFFLFGLWIKYSDDGTVGRLSSKKDSRAVGVNKHALATLKH